MEERDGGGEGRVGGKGGGVNFSKALSRTHSCPLSSTHLKE